MSVHTADGQPRLLDQVRSKFACDTTRYAGSVSITSEIHRANRSAEVEAADGVDIEDALVHLSMTLKSAAETNLQVCERVDRAMGGLAWGPGQSLDVRVALVVSWKGGEIIELLCCLRIFWAVRKRFRLVMMSL